LFFFIALPWHPSISRALQSHPHIRLRVSTHTGALHELVDFPCCVAGLHGDDEPDARPAGVWRLIGSGAAGPWRRLLRPAATNAGTDSDAGDVLQPISGRSRCRRRADDDDQGCYNHEATSWNQLTKSCKRQKLNQGDEGHKTTMRFSFNDDTGVASTSMARRARSGALRGRVDTGKVDRRNGGRGRFSPWTHVDRRAGT
uniref:Uncharacterized protein n=1 Tax=Aegilops tauschii subsp. strangulata TaxID=200361 RepID=A0A453JQ43_AEGTS